MSTEHPVIAAQAPVNEPSPSTTMSTEHPITPSPPQLSHQPSPIKQGAFYARGEPEHVQRYADQNETHQETDFENVDDLLRFLGAPTLHGLSDETFSDMDGPTFIAKANSMSKSIKEEYFKEPSSRLVVFKGMESKVPRGPVTNTECRPSITAALENDFNGSDTTFWPCIRMAGQWAPKGTSPEDQETKAFSYLHYLLLARPDLYVAQGMLGSECGIMFLFGIGGFGIRRLELRWDDEKLSKLLYAFIYRAYDPGHFADSSYTLDPIVGEDDRPTWTITIAIESQVGGVTTERRVPCSNFLPVYSSSPFETRTHVFVTKGGGVDVDGKKLSVLKDQVCRTGKRFDEHKILELVHRPKRVPGVVEAVYHKEIELPSQMDDLEVGKIKHRHGLRQLGSPFASIPTVKEMLKVAFDIVEVLRFLKAHRKILHRDISAGNVMYAPPTEDEQDPETSTQDDEVLYFSEYFLSKSPRRPQTTSVLLVDFNHAEQLTSKTDGHHKRVEQIGTFLFVTMARAVELGGPVKFLEDPLDRVLYPIPPAPDRYAKHYQNNRSKKFPPKPREFAETTERHAPWRHELDHDIESVFWLMLYWAMTAQPKGEAAEYIPIFPWSCLTEKFEGRQMLLTGLRLRFTCEGTFHSTFQPLDDLFKQLARILCSVDRHWLPASDTRNDPEYFAEAFQRLILQFLIDHGNDDVNSFMNRAIDSNPRELKPRSMEAPWFSAWS
ncbi:hypothetical protein FS837_009723 [Tulasnella sp. UAMH 9824]|nr:hypothetical protein FS837_009723 [Tulasnella sp. UAMH 9824]